MKRGIPLFFCLALIGCSRPIPSDLRDAVAAVKVGSLDAPYATFRDKKISYLTVLESRKRDLSSPAPYDRLSQLLAGYDHIWQFHLQYRSQPINPFNPEHRKAMALVNPDITNLTQSGYTDLALQWTKSESNGHTHIDPSIYSSTYIRLYQLAISNQCESILNR